MPFFLIISYQQILQEHQKEDWSSHKKLCSYLSTAAEEVGADNFFGQEFSADEGDIEVNEDEVAKDDEAAAEKVALSGDEVVAQVENELKNLGLKEEDEEIDNTRQVLILNNLIQTSFRFMTEKKYSLTF